MPERSAEAFLLHAEASQLRILQEAFEAAGFRVTASRAWAEVNQALARRRSRVEPGPPPVLVCNLALPGIRGDDFCALLLKYDSEVRVLLLADDPDEGQAAAARLDVGFVLSKAGVGAVVSAAQELVRLPADPVEPSFGPVFLVGPALREPVALGEGPVTIGRHHQRDVTLIGEGVSRSHCSVVLMGEEVEIRDHGSRNGTYVNGVRLRADVRVASNTLIEICDHFFEVRFDLDDVTEAERLSRQVFEWQTGPHQRPKTGGRTTQVFRRSIPSNSSFR